MIKKTDGITAILEKYPNTAKILLNYGMHCIGCMAAQFESLEDGCKAHGMDDIKIDEMIKAMNKEIESNT